MTNPRWIILKNFERKGQGRYKWIICKLTDGFSEEMHYTPFSFWEYKSEAFSEYKRLLLQPPQESA